jgi:hypothetical protein
MFRSEIVNTDFNTFAKIFCGKKQIGLICSVLSVTEDYSDWRFFDMSGSQYLNIKSEGTKYKDFSRRTTLDEMSQLVYSWLEKNIETINENKFYVVAYFDTGLQAFASLDGNNQVELKSLLIQLVNKTDVNLISKYLKDNNFLSYGKVVNVEPVPFSFEWRCTVHTPLLDK